MAALGVRRPNHEPRAHGTSAQVVTLAAALLAAGAAYERDGTVWFRGAEVAARAGLDDAAAARAGRRVRRRRRSTRAEHPVDVAAVAARRGAVSAAWPSPWGEGRPGLARGVRGDGADDARARARPARRRRGPALSRTTPTRRRWPRRSPASLRSRGPGCTSARSASTAPRWPSRTGNLVLVSEVLAEHPAAALRLLLLDRPWAERVGVRRGGPRRRRGPAGAALRGGRARGAGGGHRRRAGRLGRPARRPRRPARPRSRRGGGRRGRPDRPLRARPRLSR